MLDLHDPASVSLITLPISLHWGKLQNTSGWDRMALKLWEDPSLFPEKRVSIPPPRILSPSLSLLLPSYSDKPALRPLDRDADL